MNEYIKRQTTGCYTVHSWHRTTHFNPFPQGVMLNISVTKEL